MTSTIGKKSSLVFVLSILAILAYIGDIATNWAYMQDSLAEEIFPQLISALVLIPAILGLWKFRNRPITNQTLGGFMLYVLLLIGGYINAYFSTDPLAAGLPIIVIVIPYSLLFAVYLFSQIKK